ncbi:hypothetical protein [Streptobacillus ratti]|uniref:hypothetical protein n=1 Tax=Streptobacillus ratti TaxID=1720557 RepID=UPI0009F8E39E|nr:hypothetical protein [Streptobacillus ratti]
MRRLIKILRIIFWIIFFLGVFYTYSKIKYIRKSAYNNTNLILQDFSIRKSGFYENNVNEEQKQEKVEENNVNEEQKQEKVEENNVNEENKNETDENVNEENKSETDKEVDKIIKQHIENKNNGKENENQ